MSTPFIGEIKMVGEQFAPVGWAKCDGQLIQTEQNPALFSLLGTTYGGNGRTNFSLPDMRGRAPMGQGQGLALTNRPQGAQVGSEMVTITSAPLHTHSVMATSDASNATAPSGTVLAGAPANIYVSPSVQRALHSDSITSTGPAAVQPHENRQPRMAINFVIALVGLIPTQT